jgi:hypothetical protein
MFKSRFVCLFGGAVGKHNVAVSIGTVSCFDRLKNAWSYPLPHLPKPVDHHSMAFVGRGVCDEHAYLFSWGGRHAAYGRSSAHATRLRFGDSSWTNLTWSTNDVWRTRTTSAAATVSSSDGRYALVIGGLNYDPHFKLRSEIIIRDLCGSRVCVSPQSLMHGRGATWGCRHPSENKALVCGGLSDVITKKFADAMKNDPTCELVDIDALVAACNKGNKWRAD